MHSLSDSNATLTKEEEKPKKKEEYPFIEKFKKFCLDFNKKKDYKL